jgi:hypothetical protein
MGGLDWSGNSGPRATLGPPQPCTAGCGGLALLRAPISRAPLHKVCAELHPDLAAHWAGAVPGVARAATYAARFADDPAPF